MTRWMGVVGRSVVTNSSAPRSIAAATWRASIALSPHNRSATSDFLTASSNEGRPPWEAPQGNDAKMALPADGFVIAPVLDDLAVGDAQDHAACRSPEHHGRIGFGTPRARFGWSTGGGLGYSRLMRRWRAGAEPADRGTTSRALTVGTQRVPRLKPGWLRGGIRSPFEAA
jgi:hypothetical protein